MQRQMRQADALAAVLRRRSRSEPGFQRSRSLHTCASTPLWSEGNACTLTKKITGQPGRKAAQAGEHDRPAVLAGSVLGVGRSMPVRCRRGRSVQDYSAHPCDMLARLL